MAALGDSADCVDPFREFLLSIADELKDEDLRRMKFLCKNGILPDGKRETVKEPLDLIERLEEVNKLGKENLATLMRLLDRARRNDLKQMVADYQGMAAIERLLKYKSNCFLIRVQ